ncbi:phosphatidylinositol mannoside acyltransferase [Sciscionella marina]|uniref:phosphatidylinositol mannoside acyltransferase n=1 Tax=Sciscionella marina TaxID=508770 RepID=UPI000370A20A|nr:phosphatidylinositol mannoside acyltransferase [Sciscionella marina]
MKERLAAAGYAAAWAGTPLLPARIGDRAYRLGADAAVARQTAGVRRLRANLARVAGPQADLDALVRAGMRSYARYWRELFGLAGMDHPRVAHLVELGLRGRVHLDAARADGRGVVLALPHAGNWDIAGLWLASRYGRFAAFAHRLRPDSLYRRFVRARAALGIDIASGPRALYERLRAGGIVCLIADRDLNGGGLEVDFFGARSRFPTGPVRLARATGAALLPAGCWFTPAGWGVRIHPPLPVTDITAATQALADRLAWEIAAHPQDWHMLGRPWHGAP